MKTGPPAMPRAISSVHSIRIQIELAASHCKPVSHKPSVLAEVGAFVYYTVERVRQWRTRYPSETGISFQRI